jgi:hypothetical protein
MVALAPPSLGIFCRPLPASSLQVHCTSSAALVTAPRILSFYARYHRLFNFTSRLDSVSSSTSLSTPTHYTNKSPTTEPIYTNARSKIAPMLMIDVNSPDGGVAVKTNKSLNGVLRAISTQKDATSEQTSNVGARLAFRSTLLI